MSLPHVVCQVLERHVAHGADLATCVAVPVYFERPLVAACICAVPDTAMQLIVFRMFLILVSPHGIPRVEDCLAARTANGPLVIPADGHVQVTDLALARVPVTKMLQPLVLGAGPVVHAVGAVVQLKRPIVREVRVMSEC